MIGLADAVGKNGYLYIIDLKDSYFIVALMQIFYKLFGSEWYGKYIFYCCLPFGLATAPKIFQLFADSLKYIVEECNPNLYFLNKKIELFLHYLDDFFGGHPTYKLALKQFKKFYKLLIKLGIPTSPDKCTKPTTTLVILGFLLDTVTQTVSIPLEKIKKYLIDINWLLKHKNKCTIKKLDIIGGKLRHCARAMYGGAAFIRGIESLKWKQQYIKKKGDHQPFHLDHRARYDLKFWKEILPLMVNKTPFHYILKDKYNPDIILYTDACENKNTKAYGGVDISGMYFCQDFRFTKMKYIISSGNKLINLFELFAVIVAIDINKEKYKNKSLLIRCDNQVAIDWIVTQRAAFTAITERIVNIALKYLFKMLIEYKIYISLKYIDSNDNVYADKLSRLHPYWFKFIQADLLDFKPNPQPTQCKNIVDKILNQYEKEYKTKLSNNFQF